jgi:DNA-3-methyladenine glycosylase II
MTSIMPTLDLPRPKGFQLQAAAAFYESFTPGSGMAAADNDRLTFAFRLDRTFEAAAVAIEEHDDALVAEYAGAADGEAIAKQITRMLGLDADGESWLDVGRRDPVVGKLQAEFPGFFTAAKASPYDAATWSILAARIRIPAAAKLKIAIAEAHGDPVTLHGRTHHVFPSPSGLEKIDSLPGLSEDKLARLQGVGRAAREGRLEADRLRAMTVETALAELMTIRGIGPWGASHILFRGAAIEDGLPTAEPRVLHGAASAYRIAVPSAPAFEQMAEAWRPFRMWVCILLSRHLARRGLWRTPGLGRERRAAGKRAPAVAV